MFTAFASFGRAGEAAADLDGRSWVKLLKDAGLLHGGFTSTDGDLIFAKIKDKGHLKINFTQFCAGLDLVATKKKTDRAAIDAKVEAAKPAASGTKAEANKFHDDKSLYTGVYANGGPQAVDKSKAGAGGVMANLCDRTAADVRGVKK